MTNNKQIAFFSKELKEEKEYWLHKLSPESGSSYLLLDHERPSVYSPHDESVEVCLPAESVSKLARLSNGSALLTYTVLLTALKVCLHKYSGKTAVAVGSPARKRSDA